MSLAHAIILAAATSLVGVVCGVRLGASVTIDRLRMRGAFDEKKWNDSRREEKGSE
jgi:hypothetical protein